MDKLSIKRFNDKINYIIDNIKDLPKVTKNKFEKEHIFYSLQTSIEAMIDLIAMLVKDMGVSVKDDAPNISEIVNRRKLGLAILDSVEEIKTLLYQWIEVAKAI